MQKLVKGIHHFQKEIFTTKRALFAKLHKGQRPECLFITCSDSRVDPSLLLQVDPGEVFILRNAGNLVPVYDSEGWTEAASIEYSVIELGVKDIIICGHSHCGAMSALLGTPESTAHLPAVTEWLRHADRSKQIVKENYTHLSGKKLLSATVEENVLVQVENLKTHPCVARALENNAINIHAWVYHIESGAVFYYDPLADEFLPLSEDA